MAILTNISTNSIFNRKNRTYISSVALVTMSAVEEPVLPIVQVMIRKDAMDPRINPKSWAPLKALAVLLMRHVYLQHNTRFETHSHTWWWHNCLLDKNIRYFNFVPIFVQCWGQNKSTFYQRILRLSDTSIIEYMVLTHLMFRISSSSSTSL